MTLACSGTKVKFKVLYRNFIVKFMIKIIVELWLRGIYDECEYRCVCTLTCVVEQEPSM